MGRQHRANGNLSFTSEVTFRQKYTFWWKYIFEIKCNFRIVKWVKLDLCVRVLHLLTSTFECVLKFDQKSLVSHS